MTADYLTYREAADLLDTTVDNIRHKVQRNQLTAFTHPTSPALKVIPRQEIEALLHGPMLEPVADLPEPPPAIASLPTMTTTRPERAPAPIAPPAPPAPALVGISSEQGQAAYEMLVQAAFDNEIAKHLDRITAETERYKDRIRKRQINTYAGRFTRWIEGSIVTPALPAPEQDTDQ